MVYVENANHKSSRYSEKKLLMVPQTEVNPQIVNVGRSIALVGQPNVGKSAIFQRLTGQRVIISNYPGTTVEVARGASRSLPGIVMVDTPGVIAFPPHTEDERVTEQFLISEPLKSILHVGDAKNYRRTFTLAVQLAEMRLPLVLAFNMMDEAESLGLHYDFQKLSRSLGIPVVPTTAIHGFGIQDLNDALNEAQTSNLKLDYGLEIEAMIDEFSEIVETSAEGQAQISSRALALLWLGSDSMAETWLKDHLEKDVYLQLENQRQILQENLDEPISALIQRTRQEFVRNISDQAITQEKKKPKGFLARLGHLTTHPVWGWFILAFVLYIMYWFVGVFGSGIMVGLFEENLFGQVINPWVITRVQSYSPFPLLADFLVGEYGLWTMGMTYAFGLVLPIVTTFFLAFGIMEDSGYLPRLAVLSNRGFQALGLNGKAVLPMVLGLGCVTMATLTTRVLESKRERVLVTLLLALAVPCSAQLGVVMGMLAEISFTAVMIWTAVILVVFLVVGWLAARLLPGERSLLLVELPPLRLPLLSNVTLKTLARVEWYLKEVVPLFLIGAALMFILDKTGILNWLVQVSEPLVTGWLGLPPEASAAFLMGFIRRDFGASGLFVMQSQGLLNPVQVLVAMVTVTLFVPCIASVLMIAKERGWHTALGVVLFIFPSAIFIGGLLNRLLLLIGWGV